MKPLYNPKLITNEFTLLEPVKLNLLRDLFVKTKTKIDNKKFENEQKEKPFFLSRLLELLGYIRGETYQIEVSAMGRSIDAAIQQKIDNETKNYVAIEWKGIDTKTLDSQKAGETPVSQMWDYMGKAETEIGLVSNFLEYRIYTLKTKQSKYQSYTLNQLCTDEYKLKEFYHLLRASNVIKKEKNKLSVIEELIEKDEKNQELITSSFYKLFKSIRLNLFDHIVINNSTVDKLLILEKTQKILDRFVFTLFCEDRFLLPKNIIRDTYHLGLNSRRREDTKIWDEFKLLFEDIDIGRDEANLKINGYNGGLFLKDKILDSLIIKDQVWPDIISLSEFDFNSDLDVNILGHIFEQSIKDLEIIKFKILGIEVDENISTDKKLKKKKEGVFYTNENLTQYIVHNTVGNWLEDNKDNPLALDTITVIDPAGGSGAFLNQAHSYLTEQHAIRLAEDIKGEFVESNLDKNVQFNLDKSILNNNLFMVDLQPESVEIAKLSLWLKTAKKNEKLNNLDNNIKCGNSLINDNNIAGNRAFEWEKEFPTIINNGGFDIIVGNPPWVFARDQNFDDRTKEYYLNNYKLCNYQINTYLLFIEKSYSLLKVNGYLGFVLPNTWMTISTFEPLRKFILENTADIKVLNIMYKAFEDASVDCSVLIFKKSKSNTIQFGEFSKDSVELFEKVDVERVNKDTKIFNISEFKNIKNTNWVEKLESNCVKLIDLAIVKSGLKAYEVGKGIPIQTEEMKKNRIYHSIIKLDESWSKYLEGSDINRYELNWNNNYIQYGKNLASSRDVLLYNQIRILVRQIPSRPPFSINACLVHENMMINDLNSMIITSFKNDSYYILGCLNSKILSKWFLLKFDKLQRGLFPQFKVNELAQFPIPIATDTEQKEVAVLVEELIQGKQGIKKIISDTLVSIFYELGIKEDKINDLKKEKTLLNFMNLEFSKFSEELSKKNIVILLSKRTAILEYFNEQKLIVNNQLKSIDNLDQNIEKLVSKLYGVELLDK